MPSQQQPPAPEALVVHTRFDAAFRAGAVFLDGRARIPVEQRVLGEVTVTSGRIAAGDPFTAPLDGTEGFRRRVPVGRHPVEVVLAKLPPDDVRVACARVRFAEEPAVRWEVAALDGLEELEDESPPRGFGVDSGTAGFYDGSTRLEADSALIEEWLEACDRNYVDTWTWHASDSGGTSIVMFSSGCGDGVYLSYWGFDAAGRVVELVSDFEVLVAPIETTIRIPLPLPRGRVVHPGLAALGVSLETPLLFGRTSFTLRSRSGIATATMSDDSSPAESSLAGDVRQYRWDRFPRVGELVIHVEKGTRPLDPIGG